MKKNLPVFIKQKHHTMLGLTSSVQKRVVFLTSLLTLLCCLPFLGFSQSDGDYRSIKTGGGWASPGTWEVYSQANDTWVVTPTAWAANAAVTVGLQRSNGGNLYVCTVAGTTAASGGPTGTGTGIIDGTATWDYVSVAVALAPAATTNVTIMDGVFQTSNGSGYVTNNLTVGQGNAFSGTAILDGTGAVSSITINNAGALMANPGVTFIGAGTTLAVATPTFKLVGGYYRNKGTGYTTATVTIGTAWVASTAYAVGVQRSNGGNLYTVVTAGTSDVTGGPTGTGTNITDGTVVWNYSGTAATAHATISGGKITEIVVDNAGAGYIPNGASLPGITITGDGTGAIYAVQMGVDNIVITNGGSYTVAPQVMVGSIMQVGNSGNVRTVTVNGDLTFKSGANIVSGTGSATKNQVLNIGGNLSAETPVSFISVVPASTSSTAVNFTKAGTATISGAGSIAFNNLNISATTTLTNDGTITISGTTNYNDILGFDFTTPAVTGTLDATAHTVALSVPGGTILTALVPTLTLRKDVTVSPLSGVAQDFTSPVTYTTTAPGGVTTQAWTVTVTAGAIAPAAPNATAATSLTTTSYSANWDPAANATGYYLDVATDNAFTTFVTGFNNKDVVNVTTFSVTGLASGTTYYYRVRAYNTGGTSVSSNVITAITTTTAPSAPVASAATAITQTGLTANWAASTGATGYYLDVATDNAFANKLTNYNNLQVTSGLSVAVTGLTAGTTYYYQVRAYNAGGTSANSSVITAITVPAAPVANDATSILKNSFSANWAASTGATGYYLDVATDNSFTTFVSSSWNNKDVGNVTTFSVTDLTAATTYYYRVRAYNTGGTSTSSNTKTALSLGTNVQSLAANTLGVAVNANTVELEANSTIVSVQVVNVNGKLVVEKSVGATKVVISTEGWSSGIYVFTIQTQDGTFTRKIGIVK